MFLKKLLLLKTWKNHPQKLLIICPTSFLCTGLAAQMAQKQKSSTTKSPLMQDWVFRLGFQCCSNAWFWNLQMVQAFIYVSEAKIIIYISKFCFKTPILSFCIVFCLYSGFYSLGTSEAQHWTRDKSSAELLIEFRS